MWNYARTERQIRAAMHRVPTAGEISDMFVYYNMDQPGYTLYDQTGA